MNNTAARRRTTVRLTVLGSMANKKKLQKFHPTSPRKCSDTRCGEPPAINNKNAQYNRNYGSHKIFYYSQATSRGKPPLSKLNTKLIFDAFISLNTYLYTKSNLNNYYYT